MFERPLTPSEPTAAERDEAIADLCAVLASRLARIGSELKDMLNDECPGRFRVRIERALEHSDQAFDELDLAAHLVPQKEEA